MWRQRRSVRDRGLEFKKMSNDEEEEAALRERIEATVERALVKALDPMVTTLKEARKVVAEGSGGK